jgi:uncharacterized membrane protein YccC
MSEAQVNALRGVVLAVLAALVAAGVVTPDVNDAVVGVAAAVLTAVAAFLVKRPKDS